MTTETKIIIGAVSSTVLILVAAIVVLGQDKRPNRDDLGQASMSIDKKSEDLGSMKITDEKTAAFTITNTGNSPLRLWNVTTSCSCTFATITIEKDKTGEFSMHGGGPLKNWIGEIPPAKNAILSVVYRPSLMPVQGQVSRQVTFDTNDPKNPEITVSINANVQ